MEPEKKLVDGTPGASKEPVVASDKAAKDIADILLETDAELTKVREEKENYRTGLLKAKGKLSDEDLEAENERIRAIARDEFLKTKEGELSKKKDDLIKQLAQENKELRTANTARAGVTPTTAGGGSPSEKPQPNSPLSADLISKLKNERGWTDEMIKDLEDKQKARQAGTGR